MHSSTKHFWGPSVEQAWSRTKLGCCTRARTSHSVRNCLACHADQVECGENTLIAHSTRDGTELELEPEPEPEP